MPEFVNIYRQINEFCLQEQEWAVSWREKTWLKFQTDISKNYGYKNRNHKQNNEINLPRPWQGHSNKLHQ